MNTVREILRRKTESVSRFETELLLAYALGKPREFLLAHPEYFIPKKISARFFSILERRKHHEPISLITGRKEFFGRIFFVNRHTLTPRPETELLIEKTAECIASMKKDIDSNEKSNPIEKRLKEKTLVIDIGTGSGNIITTLILEIGKEKISKENISFIATDISKEALSVARKNAKMHTSDSCIRFIQSNLLEKIPKKFFRNARSIIIVANLPYLSSEEYESAPLDVRNFEPVTALLSGKDGLDHYRLLFEALSAEHRKRKTCITIFVEISPSQIRSIKTLARKYFPTAHMECFRDIARKWRLVRVSIFV